MDEQHAPVHAADCTFNERTDEPEMGFGLAGGGYGAYSWCPICGVILHKTQEHDERCP